MGVRRILAEHNRAVMELRPDSQRESNASAALEVLAEFFPMRERWAFKQSLAESMAHQFDEVGEPLPPGSQPWRDASDGAVAGLREKIGFGHVTDQTRDRTDRNGIKVGSEKHRSGPTRYTRIVCSRCSN